MTSCGGAGRGEVYAIVLAAGASTRMSGGNKLLALFGGVPLVRRVVERVAASRVAGTVVVTGHEAQGVEAAIGPLPTRLVHNPDFALGLAGSLRAGIAALPPTAAGAMIMLADMPAIETRHLDRMILTFKDRGCDAVVRATDAGQPGNPVLLPRRLLARAAAWQGDLGARRLIENGDAEIVEVEIGPAASLDVDTAEALAAAGGSLP